MCTLGVAKSSLSNLSYLYITQIRASLPGHRLALLIERALTRVSLVLNQAFVFFFGASDMNG
jgi:hypothetical protein